MISLYPKLKYTDEMIEDTKNLNIEGGNVKKVDEEKKESEDNHINLYENQQIYI